MDPYSEERLADEVIYLHALWHIGPPTSTTRPNYPPPIPLNHPPHPPYVPRSYPTNPSRNNLQIHTPSSSAQPFKKAKNQASQKTKPKTIEKSDKEWPCEEPIPELPSTSGSGWPELKSLSSDKASLTDEQKAKLNATQVQQKGLEAVRAFFNNENNDEDEHEIVDDEEENEAESEEFEFFLNLFRADGELKDYYVKSWERGEFCCLVCGGVGQKAAKRFKSCFALVQHSVSISKTARRTAHRAYGQAICKVLGWDIKKLPMNGSLSAADYKEAQKQDTSSSWQEDQDKTLTEATVPMSDLGGQEVIGCESAMKDGNDDVPAVDVNAQKSPCAADIPGLANSTVEKEDGDVGGAAAESKDDEGNTMFAQNDLTEDCVNQNVQPMMLILQN